MWHDWAGHLGVVDPDGMARFVQTGMLIFHTPGDDGTGGRSGCGTTSASPTSCSTRRARALLPAIDLGAYFPPKRDRRPRVRRRRHGRADSDLRGRERASSTIRCCRPTTLRMPPATTAPTSASTRRWSAIERSRRCASPASRSPAGDTHHGTRRRQRRRAPLGRASTRWPASPTACASVTGRCARRCSPCEAPEGLRLEDGMPAVADLDIGQYLRPQIGGTWLVGGTEPECDELHWVDDPDHFDEYPTVERFEGRDDAPRPASAGVRRAAPAGRSGRAVRRGGRLGADLRQESTCPASSWPVAPAATSSRTRRSRGSS